MLEIIFLILIYFLNFPLWWILGLAIVLNRFLNKPVLLLAIFSPIFWVNSLYDIGYFESKRLIFFFFQHYKMNFVEVFFFFCLSLLVCFLIYWLIVILYRRFDKQAKHPLLFLLLFYLFVFAMNKLFQSYHLNIFRAIGVVVLIFFSNAFVMLAYELKDFQFMNQKNIFQRFLLLNTLHSSSSSLVGTQISPKGAKEFYLKQVKDFNNDIYKKKALKILLICLLLKMFSDILGYLLLGVDVEWLAKLNLPTYIKIDSDAYQSVPRIATLGPAIEKSFLYLIVVLRAFYWFSKKVITENQNIAILWFFGFSIELGVHNPFKATSFIDFFRRTNVYIANFYKVFIYPYMISGVAFIENIKLRKSLAVWGMVFVGGLIHQTVKHYYQLYSWNLHEIWNLFIVRIFYGALLATFISISLSREKLEKRSKRSLPKNFLIILVYIVAYTIIMSIPYSIKTKGFSLPLLIRYFEQIAGLI